MKTNRQIIRLKIFLSLFLFNGYCTHKANIDPQALNIHQQAHMCSAIPPAACFVILNHNGQNLAASSHDTLGLTYQLNGIKTFVTTNTFKLLQTKDDTQYSSAYGGIGFNSNLGDFSTRTSAPIDSFSLYVNHQVVGKIYYHQRRLAYEQGCFTKAVITFNGLSVPIDTTVLPFVGLIQLQ